MDQEEKIYSIKLTDGTVIENLRLNGNVFISAECTQSHRVDHQVC